MLPGLKVGDFILVKKFTYGIKVNRTGPPIAFGTDPELGDVVVFIPPHDHRPFVKRLIGKPGDRITYINKKIYVNGKPINQKLLSEKDNLRIYEELLKIELFRFNKSLPVLIIQRNGKFQRICILLLAIIEITQMTADIGVLFQEKILWEQQIIFGCLGSVGHVHQHLGEQVKLINVQAAI